MNSVYAFLAVVLSMGFAGCSANHAVLNRAQMKPAPKILILAYDRSKGPRMQQDTAGGSVVAGVLGGAVGGAIYGSMAADRMQEQKPLLEKINRCDFPLQF